jgi:hypothetical protein
MDLNVNKIIEIGDKVKNTENVCVWVCVCLG